MHKEIGKQTRLLPVLGGGGATVLLVEAIKFPELQILLAARFMQVQMSLLHIKKCSVQLTK